MLVHAGPQRAARERIRFSAGKKEICCLLQCWEPRLPNCAATSWVTPGVSGEAWAQRPVGWALQSIAAPWWGWVGMTEGPGQPQRPLCLLPRGSSFHSSYGDRAGQLLSMLQQYWDPVLKPQHDCPLKCPLVPLLPHLSPAEASPPPHQA